MAVGSEAGGGPSEARARHPWLNLRFVALDRGGSWMPCLGSEGSVRVALRNLRLGPNLTNRMMIRDRLWRAW